MSGLWCSSWSVGQCVPACCLLSWDLTTWIDVGPGKTLKKMKDQVEEDVGGMGLWDTPQGLEKERTRRLRVSLHSCRSCPSRKNEIQLGKHLLLC